MAAVAIAGAAVYVTASAAGYSLGFNGQPAAAAPGTAVTDKAGSGSAVCDDFVSHLSSDLGVSQAKFDEAFQQAVAQTLADEVKKGDLTQAQADAIQKNLTGKPPCALVKRHGKPGAAGSGYRQAFLTAAAAALGITPEQLKADLASGMTLSQIAAAQNPPVTEAQFRTRVIAALKPLLDKLVAAGKLTSAQEQAILQRLQAGPIPLWDKTARS